MAKAPKDPGEIVQPFVDDLVTVFGQELVSVALYGGAARGEYQPSRSDINFFVVLTPGGMDRLEDVMPFIPKWRKWRVAVPRFVTQTYVERSLDSFPIEFLSLKLFHRTVHGEDLLSGLEIKREHLRLQCERELKGKLLHLREGYLVTGGKKKAMEQLIAVSLPTFATVFEALVYLKGEAPPSKRGELFAKVSELFGLDGSVFQDLIAIRSGQKKLDETQLREVCRRYILQVEAAAEMIDQLS